MKTNRLAAAASTAVLALSGLIACSPDQATSPVARIPGPAVFNLAGSVGFGWRSDRLQDRQRR